MDYDPNKAYIIGETAYNHEGDIDYLYRMIDDVSHLELNAIKFHLVLNPDSYLVSHHPLMGQLKKWIFTENQWDDIIRYSNKKRIDVICLCDDAESVKYVIDKKSVSAIEVHASGLNDYFLLEESTKFDKTIILGIGGSTIDEIFYAIDLLNNKGKKDVILMYGFQSYPTRYADINLSKMIKIRDLFNLPIGYADHTAFDDPNNEIISVMAATMGVNLLEKHYTPNYGKERIDYHSAVGYDQMVRIKELMNLALTVHGDGSLKMTPSELEYGNTGPMKKAIVAKERINKGEKLTIDKLWFKRTEKESPIRQNQFLQLIGLETIKTIEKDEIINFDQFAYRFKKGDIENFTHL